MKISAWLTIINDKPQKILNRLTMKVPETMMTILSRIGYIAESKYMRGPYPERLRRGYAATKGTGRLGQYIGGSESKKVEISSNEIQGQIFIGEKDLYYGLIWEAVGRYSHRRGAMFPKSGHPMHRPFIEPAYEEYKREIIEQLQNSITEGL